MKKSILAIFVLSISLFGVLALNTQAKTINYGSLARGNGRDGVGFEFKFDKRLSHVNLATADNVAVYDTRITNHHSQPLKFYFSNLYFAGLYNKYVRTNRVNQPHAAVVIKPHSSKTIYNSFRDTTDVNYSVYWDEKGYQVVLQYYRTNHWYLIQINKMHNSHGKYGWYPKNSWTKS
ncbi:MAG TPA: hypothetical protein DDW71_00545 [Lactobacillus sp.]|nr:hypothetical protein [Lactobacillus sp.]